MVMRKLLAGCAIATGFVALCAGAPLGATPLSIEQFRSELVGVPLCGTPETGPLAGKAVCTVHLADGTALVAGAGLMVRGLWDNDENRICRRAKDDPLERRHCVTYERVDATHYKNSDGVVSCIGPCPPAEKAQATPNEPAREPAKETPDKAPEPAPAEVKPAETKPAETKPAEPPPTPPGDKPAGQ